MNPEIQRTAEALRLEHHQHNTRAAINRLPPELLAQIFVFVQDDYRHVFPISPRLPYGKPQKRRYRAERPTEEEVKDAWFNIWIRVTHVCQHWRKVAESFPRLWTLLSATNGIVQYQELVTRLFKHARGLPMELYVLFTLCGTSASLKNLVSSQNDNQKVLNVSKLCIHEAGLRKTTPEWLDYPAPFLHTLSIEVAEDWNWNGDTTTWSSTGRSPLLFGGHVPALKKLHLSRLTWWEKNQFRNLTTVCLSRQYARPALREFLSFLRYSPRLEELSLLAAGPEMKVGEHEDIVHLPFLRIIQLGFDPHLHQLLRYLDVPFRCTKVICCTNLTHDAGRAEVLHASTLASTLSIIRTEGRDVLVREGTLLTLGITNGGMLEVGPGGSTFTPLLWSAFQGVKVLYVKGGIYGVQWFHLLGSLPSLKKLYITDPMKSFTEIEDIAFVDAIARHVSLAEVVFAGDVEGGLKKRLVMAETRGVQFLLRPPPRLPCRLFFTEAMVLLVHECIIMLPDLERVTVEEWMVRERRSSIYRLI